MDGLITFLNPIGKSFVDFALLMLIQSSILIIVLLGLDLVLRRKVRAVLRYWIWILVLVKLVLPTTLSSPTGMAYWFGDKLPDIVTEKSSAAEESETMLPVVGSVGKITLPESIVASPPVKLTNPQSVSAAPVESDIVVEPAIPASPVTWQALVFLAWLLVAATMILLLIQRTFYVRGLVAQSKNAGGTIVHIFEQCCEQIGIHKRVALKLSSVAASPSVCGLFRATILMPKSLPEKLDSRHLNSVLLHELAHIKRGDLWFSFIQTMLQIAYVYSPLLWVANAGNIKASQQRRHGSYNSLRNAWEWPFLHTEVIKFSKSMFLKPRGSIFPKTGE